MISSGSASTLLYPMMVGPRIFAKLLWFILVSLAAATCRTEIEKSLSLKLQPNLLQVKHDESHGVSVWLGQLRDSLE